jgi:uncharacterized membrane protein
MYGYKGGECIMAHMIAGLFKDSKEAGEAVSQLLQMKEVDDISVISKDAHEHEARTHQIKQNVEDGALTGALTGGVLGLIAGVSAVVVPGFGGLLVAGPLATAWGLTGGALGALSGGIVGALVDAGIPEKRAKMYEERIREGEVLVTATTGHGMEEEVRKVMSKHNVDEINTIHADI